MRFLNYNLNIIDSNDYAFKILSSTDSGRNRCLKFFIDKDNGDLNIESLSVREFRKILRTALFKEVVASDTDKLCERLQEQLNNIAIDYEHHIAKEQSKQLINIDGVNIIVTPKTEKQLEQLYKIIKHFEKDLAEIRKNENTRIDNAYEKGEIITSSSEQFMKDIASIQEHLDVKLKTGEIEQSIKEFIENKMNDMIKYINRYRDSYMTKTKTALTEDFDHSRTERDIKRGNELTNGNKPK